MRVEKLTTFLLRQTLQMSLLDQLTDEQRKAYDLVEQGKSIFLTGPGGTGKSFLLKTMYEMIPDRRDKHVAVTALTGCAALLIGKFAKTLHAWAGIGLGRESATVLAATIRRSGKALRRWLGTDILIIDATYTDAEYYEKGNSKIGWGHSTWQEAVKVAKAAGVKQLILFHHDPSHTDDDLDAIAQEAVLAFPATIVAREGLAIDLFPAPSN
jgi:energy-coupling factor transporter ATP-binding protein EcfA2